MTLQHVTEFAANAPENIEHFAKLLARSVQKRAVFAEIYRGQQQRPKTAAEIADRIPGMSMKRVLETAGPLASHHLFEQTKRDGLVAYRKYKHVNAVKKQILRLARDRKKLAQHATVRKPQIIVQVKGRDYRKSVFVDARHLTIDEIDNFKKVRRFPASSLPRKLPEPLPEAAFKQGFARILGNRGVFKDWGGERNDLYTTQLAIKGRRYAASIGFKGPGTKSPVTPGKMGKRGDQIQRLFTSSAHVFLVQFEGDIAESVPEQLRKLAIAESLALRQTVWYGIIAREDSARLRLKYQAAFKSAARLTHG